MSAYSINEIVELAVQIEHNGYAFYNEAIKHKGLDTKSVELLTILRDQELIPRKDLPCPARPGRPEESRLVTGLGTRSIIPEDHRGLPYL